MTNHKTLSRREREMMDILYRQGRATAADIHQSLPDPPSYSAVRAKLKVLEEKGHIRHEEQSLRYLYFPRSRRIAPRPRPCAICLRPSLITRLNKPLLRCSISSARTSRATGSIGCPKPSSAF